MKVSTLTTVGVCHVRGHVRPYRERLHDMMSLTVMSMTVMMRYHTNH